MSYQAIIRNAIGELVREQPVGMRISLLQGSVEGNVVYNETQNPTTNANGLVSIEIGGLGLEGVDWSDGPLFIKTETDPTGGTNYTIAGTSQLLSVPYALHAKTVSSFMGVGDLIIPVMVSAEILNLEPHKGQTVYNSDGNLIQVYDGTNWSSFNMDCWPLPTTANAGPNQSFTGDSTTATMAANTPKLHHGKGYWSIISGEGGSFDDNAKPDALFTLQSGTSYQLRWTITTTCGISSSDVSIIFVVEVINPATGKTWMDRNLGASRAATSSTDAEAYGDLYQWGRAADGHQKRNSGTTLTLSSSDTPGHGNFILTRNNPWDWRSPQNTNMWQGGAEDNNPCPPGYRLPTEAELTAERQSWISDDADGAFASPLKLPVAGSRSRSNVSFANEGYAGYYWSGTVSNTNSRSLSFYKDLAGMVGVYRAYGHSVRCIKE